MDIRRACGDRIEHHFLDVFDDGGVFDLAVVFDRRLRAAFLEADFDVLERGHFLQRRAARFDDFGDRVPELVVLDDDGLDRQVVLEADFLQRLQICGVGDRDIKAIAAFVQRQHAPRLRDLGVEIRLIDMLELEGIEVE